MLVSDFRDAEAQAVCLNLELELATEGHALAYLCTAAMHL